VFNTRKTRMSGLPCSEGTMTICLAFSTKYRNVTDRQTDRIAISILRVSVLMRDKNKNSNDRRIDHPSFDHVWMPQWYKTGQPCRLFGTDELQPLSVASFRLCGRYMGMRCVREYYGYRYTRLFGRPSGDLETAAH